VISSSRTSRPSRRPGDQVESRDVLRDVIDVLGPEIVAILWSHGQGLWGCRDDRDLRDVLFTP
jgi:hypothetical protein